MSSLDTILKRFENPDEVTPGANQYAK